MTVTCSVQIYLLCSFIPLTLGHVVLAYSLCIIPMLQWSTVVIVIVHRTKDSIAFLIHLLKLTNLSHCYIFTSSCWAVDCTSSHLSWWYIHLPMHCWRHEWDHHLEGWWDQRVYATTQHSKCPYSLWVWQSFHGYNWNWVWNKRFFIHISYELHCKLCTEWYTSWVFWTHLFQRCQ